MPSIEMVADGLFFPEGPRWRAEEQKLYFSDVLAEKVMRVDDGGTVETVMEPGDLPSGLGFVDGGDLLLSRCSRGRVPASGPGTGVGVEGSPGLRHSCTREEA